MSKKISVLKAKPAAPKRAAKPASPKKKALSVAIDYPEEGEVVRPGHYTVRLTAAGAGQAQCRLDGEGWLDCREAVGHFWLDWSPRAGEVRLEARARAGKGRWAVSPARVVVVPD
jgi:hypothetical protein